MGKPYTVSDALRDGVVKPIHWQPRVTDWQLHGTKLDLALNVNSVICRRRNGTG